MLLVEADPTARSVMLQVLQNADHAVVLASRSEQIVARLAESDFDVVMASVEMPGFNGLDLLQQLRASETETEVILVTRQASVKDAVACLRAGVFDYLEQPVSPEDVEVAVGRAVERRRLRASNALYRASRVVFQTPDPEQLPQRIVQLAMDVMAADDASLMLPDEEGRLHLVYSHELPALQPALEPGEGVAGRLASQRRPALINDVISQGSRFSKGPRHERVHSSIVFPLFSGERLVGVLNLNRMATTRPFRQADLGLAGLLASQTVLALENARLFRDQRRQLREIQDNRARLVESERLAAIGQVSAGMIHEINNPASYILSNLFSVGEILEELSDQIDPEVLTDLCQAVGEASEGARRIRDILRDVRALARSDEPDPRPFDLNDSIRSALRLGRAAVQGRARVEAHLGPDVRVVGDASRLSQVFLNLLVNAAHAIAEMPAGSHRITLSSRRQQDRVTVRISDTGPGIEAALVERIFDPFFTTRRPTAGTGLGLSISREIVRDHGGELTVDSVEGVGTTFTLTLAAAPGDPRAAAGDQIPARLLFVAADPAARRAYTRQFGQDHEVAVARDLEDARAALRERGDFDGVAFDLVVCEPGADAELGARLHRHLKSEWPDLVARLVFVTDADPTGAVLALLRTAGAPRSVRPVDAEWLLGLTRR